LPLPRPHAAEINLALLRHINDCSLCGRNGVQLVAIMFQLCFSYANTLLLQRTFNAARNSVARPMVQPMHRLLNVR
jgi:hypothetical protein